VTVRFQAVVLRFTPTAEQGVEDAYAFVDRHRDLWVGINMAGRADNEKGYPGRFLSVYRKMMGKYPAISLSIHAGESDEPIHHVRDTLFLGALRSGVMAYDRMRENEITVGLASDVAAGPELNPWEVMKAASYGQNVRSCYVRNAKTFSPAELFHLATVSSAAVLGKQSEIGQLRKGFMADCALWDTRGLLPYRSKLPHQPSELVSLLIYRGARLEATKVWLAVEVVWPEAKAGI